MKRILSIFACLMLLVAMIFTVAACGPKDEGKGDGEQTACTEHEYTAKVTKEATCGAEGEKTFTCNKCGATKTEPIAPIAHTEEVIPGTAAKCGVAGLKDGKKCSVCGTVTLAQEAIAALEHKYVGGKCDNCGEWDPNANVSTYVLDSSELEVFAKGAYTDGDSITAGTQNFFTILMKGDPAAGKGSCVEDRDDAVTFEDGKTYNRRLSLGGKSSVKNGGTVMYPAIKINVEGATTVKIWWVCGKGTKTGRYMAICTADGTVIDDCAPGVAETAYITTLEISEAGEYYISNMIDNNYIYRIEVSSASAE